MKFIPVICWIMQLWTLGLLVLSAVSYRDEWMFTQALWRQRCISNELKKTLGWFLDLLCQQSICDAMSPVLNNDSNNCLMPVPVPPALPWPGLSPGAAPKPVDTVGMVPPPIHQAGWWYLTAQVGTLKALSLLQTALAIAGLVCWASPLVSELLSSELYSCTRQLQNLCKSVSCICLHSVCWTSEHNILPY